MWYLRTVISVVFTDRTMTPSELKPCFSCWPTLLRARPAVQLWTQPQFEKEICWSRILLVLPVWPVRSLKAFIEQMTPNSKPSTVRMVMRRDDVRKSGQGPWLEISNNKGNTTTLKRREWWPWSILRAAVVIGHALSQRSNVLTIYLLRQSCVVSGFKQSVNVRFKPGLWDHPIQPNSLNLRHINISF